MSATRAIGATFVLWTAATVLVAALVEPAAAGHGSVDYKNPKKIAEEKAREAEAAQGVQAAPPAAAQPATAHPMATPAGAVETVVVPGADRDYTFASAMYAQLADASKKAEDQIASGKDAKLNAVAKNIVESNRKQMAELDQWMAAHPPK